MTKHVIDKEYLRDRPLSRSEKFINYLFSDSVISSIFVLPVVLFALPFLFPLFYLVILLLVASRAFLKTEFPFFAPVSSGEKMDRFNPDPAKDKETGEVKFNSAGGISYFGNVFGSGEQVWFSNNMLRQHLAFLATTGSGKTFTISSIGSANALLWGAGYMYIDAKADLDIIRMHQSLLWRTNRIDDLFIFNYIRGGRDRDAYASDKTTNTYNLLEKNSSAQNTETMKSLMQGDNDIWAKRADSLLAALLKPTHYMRDKAMLNLSIPALLDYLVIETAGSLLSNESIPHEHKKELAGFIKTLPGMTGEFFKKIEQGQSVGSTQVYDQWGFAAMQIILIINMLSGDYADIFGVTVGEIDMESIVLQDRVLLGLLPALEGSSESVASMGRIIMAARKGVMGQSLGERFVGSVQTNLKNRATNAPYPFINILDEVGMMFTSGEGAAAAQARGLGYSIWYSAQDIPAMKKQSEQVAKEVDTVLGNTMIKIMGKVLDKETFEAFDHLADVEYVWQRDSMDLSYDYASGRQYQKESRAQYSEQRRLDKREAFKLREGEMYINAVDRLFRVDGPNLHPKSLKYLLINDFWMMLPYSKMSIDQSNRDWVYMTVEYEQIINGELELKTPPSPPLRELERLGIVCQAAHRLFDNKFVATSIAFSSYILSSVNEMLQINTTRTEQSLNKQQYYKDVESQPDSTDQYERLSQLAPSTETESQETTKPVSEATKPVSNVEGTSQNDFPITPSDHSESTPEDDSDFAVTPVSDDKSVPELAQIDERTLNHTHALDTAFSANGLSKDALIESLSEISALSNRANSIKSKIKSGEMPTNESHEIMREPVTDDEKAQYAMQTSSSLSDMYRKTDHPEDPTPIADKRLVLQILMKIKQQILDAQKKGETETEN